MKNITKKSDGKYHVNGKTFELLHGSRAQVWHGAALKTSGGLKKSDLMKNKHGRIVSKKKHNTAKKEKRLEKAGYKPKKGVFGINHVKKTRKSSRKSRKSRKK